MSLQNPQPFFASPMCAHGIAVTFHVNRTLAIMKTENNTPSTAFKKISRTKKNIRQILFLRNILYICETK